MQPGFHLMEKRVLKEKDMSTYNSLSIIKFLKMVRSEEVEQFEDYTVYGFENLLSAVEEREKLAKYIHRLLREKSPFLVNTDAMFQFVIEWGRIEIWDNKPIVRLRDRTKVQLHDIFGLMESPEDDPNWFWHQLNVVS